MPDIFFPGQRWISETEPELGLGSVQRVTTRTVTLGFSAARETREYARDNAPLRRVRCRSGDTIKSRADVTLRVESVTERAGLIYYQGVGWDLCETDLNDALSFNQPQERLLAGQVEPPDVFDLRIAALIQQYRRRQSRVRGFIGGRIELIPHQLHIASEVASRHVPRVLLADEVGLGKTIEACLIVHRLILTGRAQRVLILLPESLVHQWFVELLRRFNLWFHIFDEERCVALEANQPGINPFLDDQLVLASLRFFTDHEHRGRQALAAGWDLLVVDEAHHLGWSPGATSPEYTLVERLGRQTPGLLLLTATPEQLGMASHFARLRLLDPDRFHDLGEFIKETESYRDVARLAELLQNNSPLAENDIGLLTRLLGDSEVSVRHRLKSSSDPLVGAELLDALLDQHGTSRVMFRNTRATITGFPRRRANLCPLPESLDHGDLFEALAEEFANDVAVTPNPDFAPQFSRDPRIDWLVGLLRALGDDKVLLIGRTQGKVEAIEAALRTRLNVKMAAFHEGLSLVQRDRQAAWFSEEDGARLLLCSEIGSEGRNFQFAHHLVLFDLPLDPELLEQRIGRLDRIGQTAEIQIHVPYVTGSSQEVLARWYQEGLNALEKNLPGGRELREWFGARIHDLAQDFHETGEPARAELVRLISETQLARHELSLRLEQGRDRLLELNSFRPKSAARLAQEIQQHDHDPTLERFLISVFDHYSLHVEELTPRTYHLGSAGVFADSFPGLPAGGLTVTCDRAHALAREDIQFLTWDHPLVTGTLDLLLGSELGNSSFGHWPDARVAGLYLEVIYLLECVAPPTLHVDRFLPPTPLRVLVDHQGNEASFEITSDLLTRQLEAGDPYPWLERSEIREDLLPDLLEQTQELAEARVAAFVAQARKDMSAQLDHELTRLRELQKVNRSVRAEEVELLVQQKQALDQHLTRARLRLDAIRLIQRGP